ncbi:MAG: chemotaxis protein CheW [Pirellulales bacterium]
MSGEFENATTDPLLRDFVVESMENLAEVQSKLLSIEQAGADADPELLNDVFRRVHTVKGIAGFLSLDRIAELAHALENVLSLMRDGKLVPTSEIVEPLLQGSDLLQRMVADVERSNEYDCSAHIAVLTGIAQGKPAARAEALLDVVQQGVTAAIEAVAEVADEAEAGAAHTEAAAQKCEEPAAAVAAKPQRAAEASEPNKPAAATGGESGTATIRVAVSVLENLVNLAGEMVLARNQLLRTIHSRRPGQISTVGAKLDQVTTAMQEAIMGARMQPVGTVFGRFPRMLRELTRRLKKQCRLTIEGADVELDRTILEAIVDPLTHLIRNSADHGLETPEAHRAAGKPVEGELKLAAFRRAGKVHITLSDDGRGIDRRRVLDKAVSQGLVAKQQADALGDREVYQLIFRPGFSTAEQVSEVSGRGVGMDVVKSHIEKVGGTVGIESTPGQGTTVHITLPLTLAILPAWIVHQGEYRIAVPESSIVELIRLNEDESGARIEHIDRSAVLRWRGELLPLVRLDELLPCDDAGTAARRAPPRNVIVLETGWMRYGLVVERMNNPEQIVVKPLGRHFASCPYIDGAAVLGDGRVTYVFDVQGAAAHCGLTGRHHAAAHAAEESATQRETQTALLFRMADGRKAAIARMMIQRIERVDAARLRAMHGRYVVPYEDRLMPLVTLRDDMPAPEGLGYVLVFQSQADEVGVWAKELVDIREVPTTVDVRLRTSPAALGTVVVDGEAVEILDVFELADALRDPQLGGDAKALREEAGRTTVLLVEDVQFFRQQVGKFLRRAGYNVVMAENGAKAWQMLEAGETIDIVLTDIEMPVMNGIELCRKIKADERVQRLPVVALTSLNGEADLRRGREAGFQEWQVKLDRDRLLTSIRTIVRDADRCYD